MTLRELWEQEGFHSATEVAGHAGVSVPVVYKMLRKERVQRQNMLAVCRTLNITEDRYKALEAEK
jgi:Cro/C1-type HTH DNA-binding domain